MSTDILEPGVVLFDRYRIEGEKPLGRGTSGVVYRAALVATNGPRALKVVPRGTAGADSQTVEDYRRRFRAECEIAEMVRDPNVLVVHELLEDARMWCGVFELAEGGSVADLVSERGPLDIDRAVAIVLDAARGLEAMHRSRFVHGDVKPSSILLTGPERGCGRAKVAGFGMAQWPAGTVGPEGDVAPHGPISIAPPHHGAREYSSPEHSDGSQPLLPTSDVYSLGCVAFEMLTGRMWKRARLEVERCSELRPEVPAWLDDVVARMLAEQPGSRKAHAADPARRFVGMTAVIEAIEAAAREADEPLTIRSVLVRGFRALGQLRAVGERGAMSALFAIVIVSFLLPWVSHACTVRVSTPDLIPPSIEYSDLDWQTYTGLVLLPVYVSSLNASDPSTWANPLAVPSVVFVSAVLGLTLTAVRRSRPEMAAMGLGALQVFALLYGWYFAVESACSEAHVQSDCWRLEPGFYVAFLASALIVGVGTRSRRRRSAQELCPEAEVKRPAAQPPCV